MGTRKPECWKKELSVAMAVGLLLTMVASCASPRDAAGQDLPAWVADDADGFAIAFRSNRSGQGDLYAVHPDGGALVVLATDPEPEYAPSWASARDALVYGGVADGEPVLREIGPATTTPRVLGPHPGGTSSPAWSPTDDRLVYVARGELGLDLVVARWSDGLPRVVRVLELPGDQLSPEWAPDGRRLAFSSTAPGTADVFLVDVDAGEPINVTEHAASDASPSIAPDGLEVVISSDRTADRAPDVVVVRPGEARGRSLAAHPARDLDPRWSPDGAWIAFTSDREGDFDIHVVRPDGSEVRRLTRDPAFDGEPEWIPIAWIERWGRR
jgi:TolB protein